MLYLDRQNVASPSMWLLHCRFAKLEEPCPRFAVGSDFDSKRTAVFRQWSLRIDKGCFQIDRFLENVIAIDRYQRLAIRAGPFWKWRYGRC